MSTIGKKGGILWHLLVLPQRIARHGPRALTGYWKARETKRVAAPLKTRTFEQGRVSVVITSAGRGGYLRRTLESLRRYAAYDPAKTSWLVIDDYPDSLETREYITGLKLFDKVIFNERNMGLGYSLNRVFAEIRTEFVFYCQEDFEFLRPFSFRDMIRVLRANPRLSQLLLRGEREYEGEKEVSPGYSEYDRMFGFWPFLASMEFMRGQLPFPYYFTNLEFSHKVHNGGWKVSGILGDEPSVRHIGEQRKVWVVK